MESGCDAVLNFGVCCEAVLKIRVQVLGHSELSSGGNKIERIQKRTRTGQKRMKVGQKVDMKWTCLSQSDNLEHQTGPEILVYGTR